MPMNVSHVTDERQALLAFLARQRSGLRNAAYGLTDEQARMTSTASPLSVGGLVKHVAAAEQGWIDRILRCDTADPTDFGAYLAGFRMEPEETLAGLLDRYDEVAGRTEGVIAGITALDQAVPLAKGVPWFPDDASVRWVLLHLIEETARHAGHADIIRESLDEASSGSLMAAAEGWAPTDWVQPWKPSTASA